MSGMRKLDLNQNQQNSLARDMSNYDSQQQQKQQQSNLTQATLMQQQVPQGISAQMRGTPYNQNMGQQQQQMGTYSVADTMDRQSNVSDIMNHSININDFNHQNNPNPNSNLNQNNLNNIQQYSRQMGQNEPSNMMTFQDPPASAQKPKVPSLLMKADPMPQPQMVGMHLRQPTVPNQMAMNMPNQAPSSFPQNQPLDSMSQASYQTQPMGQYRSYPFNNNNAPPQMSTRTDAPSQMLTATQKNMGGGGTQNQNQGNFQFSKTLFDQEVMVRLRSQQREDFTLPLGLKIQMQAQTNQQQTLVIEVTDTEDPLFLYSLVCTEQDFHLIREDQQLLVDFQAFPQAFTELVNYCQHQNNGYAAVFSTQDCTFSIVESNQFRALTHLKLQFKRANDDDLKKHLSERLKQSRSDTCQTQNQLQSLQQMFQNQQMERDQLVGDLQQAKEDTRRARDAMQIDTQKQLNELREKMLLEQAEVQAKHEKELKDERQTSGDKITNLSTQCDTQSQEIQQFKDLKRDHETKIKDLEQALEKKTYELDLAQNETTHLRSNTQSLDATKFQQEKSITEQVMLIQSLKRELKDKEALIEKQTALADQHQESNQSHQTTISELKQQTTKLEAKIESLRDEVGKGNQIIQKMTQQSKELHAKYKQKQQQLKDQERQTGEKGGKMEELMREAVQKTKESEILKVELNESKTLNERLKVKLSEAQEALKSNENLIAYLNKQLNEKPGGASTSFPSSSFTGQGVSNKPPLTSGFKPSFTAGATPVGDSFTRNSNAGSNNVGGFTLGARQNSMTSFDRQPSPSVQTSARGSRCQSPATQDKPINSSIAGITSGVAAQSDAGSGNSARKQGNNAQAPQFVSKYTRMLYEQQNQSDANFKPSNTYSTASSASKPTQPELPTSSIQKSTTDFAATQPKAPPALTSSLASLSMMNANRVQAAAEPVDKNQQILQSAKIQAQQNDQMGGACEQSIYSQNEFAQVLSVQQEHVPTKGDFLNLSPMRGAAQESFCAHQVSNTTSKISNMMVMEAGSFHQQNQAQQPVATKGPLTTQHSRVITPVLPVNETKMSDNEAFQAFLSRNDDGDADDSY